MNQNQSTRGVFLALEGIDGSGKTTQARLLAERLRAHGVSCLETREPTDSPMGAVIRDILVGRLEADPRVVATLFASDRLHHILARPHGLCAALERGASVVCDRYYFSSYAYQSVDLPLDWILQINAMSAKALRPDYTVFIDVAPKEAMRRIGAGRSTRELYETNERLGLVRERYFAVFERLRADEAIVIVDGNQAPSLVADAIWARIHAAFFLSDF